MTITDARINDKYLTGTNRFILEHDRIKLPKLVEKIKLNPDYMKIDSNWSSSWDEITQSRLIESLIINIPVIPIILYERGGCFRSESISNRAVEKEYKSYKVIDGRERLKTVIDFYSDRLILTGLEVEVYLEGRSYSTLPTAVRQRLNNRSLNLINCMPANQEQSELEIKKLIDAVKKRL